MDGFDSWEDFWDGDWKLYFEVQLPSPRSYRQWLAANIEAENLVPYILDAARNRNGIGFRADLEGPTHVDALMLNSHTGCGVMFEAKVLSDASCSITFDPCRNQLARNIDCMLETNNTLPEPLRSRQPDRTLFVLLTPVLFRNQPTTRLYGWLMNEYCRRPESIGQHLPHRTGIDWNAVSARLGWMTWECMS